MGYGLKGIGYKGYMEGHGGGGGGGCSIEPPYIKGENFPLYTHIPYTLIYISLFIYKGLLKILRVCVISPYLPLDKRSEVWA